MGARAVEMSTSSRVTLPPDTLLVRMSWRRVFGPVHPVGFGALRIGVFLTAEADKPPAQVLLNRIERIKLARELAKRPGHVTVGIERRIHLNRPVGLVLLLLAIGPEFCRVSEPG